MKSLLEQLLLAAIRKLADTAVPPLPVPLAITVERTRDAAHGDFASNVAIRLAKGVGKSPQEVARDIVEWLPASPFVLKAEAVGNGFINFFLASDALAREVRRIHELGPAYGRSSVGAGKRAAIESIAKAQDVAQGPYVAYRDALAGVLAAAGYEPLSNGVSSALSRPAIEGLFRQISLLRTHGPTTRAHENPLYYVQYAHARVASAVKEVKARGIAFDLTAALDKLELLDASTERALIAALLRFPEEVESAAANCAPHSIVYYLREVANTFHTYYNAENWFVAENDLRSARLALVLAAGQVLRNGLALLGVPAPESM